MIQSAIRRRVGLSLPAVAIVLPMGIAHSTPGLSPCPTTAPSEFAVVPWARNLSGICATFITCMNLDSVPRTVTCQFFTAFNNNQLGTDLEQPLDPAESGTCGTAPDPLGIHPPPYATMGPLIGKGRVCADTKKLACHAELSCRFSSGAALETLPVILKRQHGD